MALVTNDPKWTNRSLVHPITFVPLLRDMTNHPLVLQAVYVFDPNNPPVPLPMGPVGYPIVNG